MQDIVQILLMYVLVPLWLAAGVADWLCHRAARIEFSAGWKESLLHLLMLVEMGVPALAALFLEINALVFLLALVGLVLHQATVFWDIRYAQSLRRIAPVEQRVHHFLEIIPPLAFCCVTFLHWDPFLALWGLGAAGPHFALRWKSEPLPGAYIASAVAAVILLQVLPYLHELWRGIRARDSLPGSERRPQG